MLFETMLRGSQYLTLSEFYVIRNYVNGGPSIKRFRSSMLFQTMLKGVSVSNAFGVPCYSKLC